MSTRLSQLRAEAPESRDQWTKLAGRVDAYREHWNVDADHVGVKPDLRGKQARQWHRIELAIEDLKLAVDRAHPSQDWAQAVGVAPPSPAQGIDFGL